MCQRIVFHHLSPTFASRIFRDKNLLEIIRITSYNVCYTKLLRLRVGAGESQVELDALVRCLDAGHPPAQIDGLVGPRTVPPRAVIDVSPQAAWEVKIGNYSDT